MNLVQQFQALLKSIFQWWVMIAPWEQGVRVRFGKHIKLLHPGIHLRLPMFDVVYVQPIRVRAQAVGNQTLTTADGKAITVAAAIQYEIVDLLQLYSTLHNAHDTVEQKIQGQIASYVSNKILIELKQETLEKEVQAQIKLEQFGLKVCDLQLTDFAVVRPFRLINGEMGSYTGYDQRLETNTVKT